MEKQEFKFSACRMHRCDECPGAYYKRDEDGAEVRAVCSCSHHQPALIPIESKQRSLF